MPPTKPVSSTPPARAVRWLLLSLPALAASLGCVPQNELVLKFDAARFNERIVADLNGLSPDERAADQRYGFFRDGSEDPDGDGPRSGGLISEIFPVAAADGASVGNLVKTPCLFVGRGATGGDQLRVTWELVGSIDRDASDYFKEAFLEGYDEIGMCTYSSPETRVLFEDPMSRYPEPEEYHGRRCGSPGQGSVAVTLKNDGGEQPRNYPFPCRIGGNLVTRLEMLAHRADNPDGTCPVGPFATAPTTVPTFGCLRSGDLLPACALPCGVEPREDASYRVRSDPSAPGGLPASERWLRPDVMVVDGRRSVTRSMKREPPSFTFAWQAEVTPGTAGEGPLRWSENYSPTVRVETVQILSRNLVGGDEKVETPQGRLTLEIPGAAPLLECSGAVTPEGFSFSMADCAARSDRPAALAALTPTYVVADLRLDPPVRVPIIWRATLPGLAPGREVFVRFGLRAHTMAAGLRVSSALDFGAIPDTELRQGTVELENVGGETVEVTAIDLVPGAGHHRDFSFFTVGDPVPVPLPLEAKRLGDGAAVLRLGDLRDVPFFSVSSRHDAVDVQLGDPAAAPGDEQAFLAYGESVRLRGAFLTRDDVGARFTPPPSSDPRPFVVPAYAEEAPPFVLRPGERRTIVVEARPMSLGQRWAHLGVKYVAASDPRQTLEIRSVLQVQVLSGPLLHPLPDAHYIRGDENGATPGHRTGVLQNVGHFDLTVTGLQLTGPGASRFVVTTDRGGSAPFVLPPGDSLDLWIEYLPVCDGTYGTATSLLDHEATLVVASNGGTSRIALGGVSLAYCTPP